MIALSSDFHHDNDYWTERVRASDDVQICPGQDHQLVDLWNDAKYICTRPPGAIRRNPLWCKDPFVC